MKQFGLIGYPLTHSFSKKYFEDKFTGLKFEDYSFEVFPIKQLNQLSDIIQNHPFLIGLNVTIPYKETIITYLDKIEDSANKTGAVNCVKIERNKENIKLIGYNTDIIGFEMSIKPLLKPLHKRAIILGTGGGSKAAAYIFRKLGIDYHKVSRNPKDKNTLDYQNIEIKNYRIIVNTTPLGMFPEVDGCPDIPYKNLSDEYLLFDMIYNPDQTTFLRKGQEYGAVVKNGMEMLHVQADKSFEIWMDDDR